MARKTSRQRTKPKRPPAHGLGRGLSALLASEPAPASPPPSRSPAEISGQTADRVLLCPISQIRLNPRQPREHIDPAALEELSQSIRSKGVLQPILVRPADGGYELVTGERRYRAALRAGLETLPALVRNVDGRESLELTLIENLQRVDLNPIEEAKGYESLTKDFQMTQESIAQAVGKDRATVANVLRLLKLPALIQEDLRSGRLQIGHAKAILSLPSEADMLKARDEILRGGKSVRHAESIARRKKKPEASATDPNLKQLETDLRNHLGTKVIIEDRGQRGTLAIEYYSWNDLNNIVNKILD